MVKVRQGSLIKFGRIRFKIQQLVTTKDKIGKNLNTKSNENKNANANTSRLNKVQIDNNLIPISIDPHVIPKKSKNTKTAANLNEIKKLNSLKLTFATANESP